jgi:lipoic acid synthetase
LQNRLSTNISMHSTATPVLAKGIAYLDLQMKKFDDSKKYYHTASDLNPNDPENYYSIAVIDWTQTYVPRQEARAKLRLELDEALSKDEGACLEMKHKNAANVQDGIDNLNKALQLRPDYDDASAYMNLTYRERADIQCDDPIARAADLKTADEWVDKTMAIKKASARPTRAQNLRPPIRSSWGELIKSKFAMSASSQTVQLVQIDLGPKIRSPKPSWLKARAPVGDNFHNLKKLARGLGLHTVCESAQCPNIGECWDHHTATFMLLGDICTRRCGFCAVPKGRPEAIDRDEPRRVAEAVATLGLRHAVVTSVNRDDDNIGGARIFAETIRQIRELVPECRVEVLIPDFQGLEEPLRVVLDAKPNVLNHNTETVPRLYRAVRSGARYKRTLDLLSNAKKWDPATVTKSGVMVGIGEETGELIEVFRDLGECGVDILTIGQYLRPSKDHLPMTRYYTPAEFVSLKEEALKFGFKHVESGPLVRSSYHAHEQADVAAR